MPYKKKELFQKAKEAIENHRLFFIEDIVAFLPCRKSTFYKHFPIGSDEMNELKEMLEKNKTLIKVNLRRKWFTSNNPSLEICLYKICSNPTERMLLSSQYVELKSDTDTLIKGFEWEEVKNKQPVNQTDNDKPPNSETV